MVPLQGKESLQRHHGQTGCQEIDVKGCSYVLMAWSLYTGNLNFSSPEPVEYQIAAEVLFAYHNEIFFANFMEVFWYQPAGYISSSLMDLVPTQMYLS